MNYIEPIKETLDKQMHKVCALYCTIGFNNESPIYLNFGNFDTETKILTIKSTTSEVFFEVPTKYNRIFVQDFWKQFKQYRTEFLKKNYPTIDPY